VHAGLEHDGGGQLKADLALLTHSRELATTAGGRDGNKHCTVKPGLAVTFIQQPTYLG